jgi:hypothetical protein
VIISFYLIATGSAGHFDGLLFCCIETILHNVPKQKSSQVLHLAAFLSVENFT